MTDVHSYHALTAQTVEKMNGSDILDALGVLGRDLALVAQRQGHLAQLLKQLIKPDLGGGIRVRVVPEPRTKFVQGGHGYVSKGRGHPVPIGRSSPRVKNHAFRRK